MGISAEDRYGSILKQYQLQPQQIEDFGNVKKVYTPTGIYALKIMKKMSNHHFPYHIQMLHKLGFTRAVPIFPTVSGEYIIFHENHYHYLMPWLQNHPQDQRVEGHQALLKQVAKMHLYSSKKKAIPHFNVITDHYETIIKQWDERDHYLEDFVRNAEKKWFMSPFELQFCTYYYELTQASHFARSQLEKWYEGMEGQKSIRVVLTTGNVSFTHFLYDDKGKGYLTNFEKASFGGPINDLIGFYYRVMKTYPLLCEECVEGFEEYRNHFSLKDEEFHQFLGYLSYPEPLYRCVYQYVTRQKDRSEREYVQMLQRAFWLNKNIEYFSMKILENEQKRKELEEELKSQPE